MWAKLVAWWKGLNPATRGVVTAFVGGATGFLKPIVEAWASNQPQCLTSACLKHDLISAVHAGVIAVLALYLPSGLGQKKAGG